LIGVNWGELRVGRDYSPTFWNSANTDPFGYNGIAEVASFLIAGQGAMGPAAVRVSNSMSYLTPNTLGGFFLQATYAIGGNPNGQVSEGGANEEHDGDYAGANIGYQNGPLYAGLATSFTHESPTETVGGTHTTNLGVSYDFGFVKPDFFYQTSEVNAEHEFQTDVYSLGALFPLGQGELRLNYAHAKGSDAFSGSHSNMYGIGYVYNLSKRTALYGIYAHINNTGAYDFSLNAYTPGPTPGESQSGVSLGLRTSF
jgi:predicted porin